MKILIVDDEIFVRMGIKTTLDWTKSGHEIVGEAADGVEGMEMFNKYRPDIILTDILMPNMNGLDFIRLANSADPSCKFIVMSCHNEFEYVREAMKLGVRDYILKTTVKRDELLDIINKVSEEIRQEKSKAEAHNAEKRENLINRSIIIREYMNGIIDGLETDDEKIASKFEELQLELQVPGLYPVLLSAGDGEMAGKASDPRHNDLLIHGVTNIAVELFKQYTKAVVIKRNDRTVAALISLNPGKTGDKPALSLADVSSGLIKAVRDILNIRVSIGIGPEISKFSQIGDAYRKAASALERKFFTGPFSAIVYEDAYESERLPNEEFVRLEREIIQSIDQMDFEKADGILSSVRSSETIKSETDPHLVKSAFLNLVLNVIKHVEYEFLKKEEMNETGFNPNKVLEFEYFEDMMEYVVRVVHSILGAVEEKFNIKYKNIIGRIKTTIQQNPGEEMTLNAAAESVNLSPGYFSRLFKKLTGENFIDFVIKVKMENAKSMIRDGEKLWLIAQRLGYTEVSSFSRIFKRMTGVSPLQYRLKMNTPGHGKVKES